MRAGQSPKGRVMQCLVLTSGHTWTSGSPEMFLPVLWVGVFEQLCQLQRILADLLNRGEQETIQGNVNHFLEQSARLEEKHILADLHELRELEAGVGMVVAVLWVDLEICLLHIKNSKMKVRGKNLPPLSGGKLSHISSDEQSHRMWARTELAFVLAATHDFRLLLSCWCASNVSTLCVLW